MSSSKDAVEKGARGRTDLEARWVEVRQKVARAVISDPDIVFYFAYLSSNRARKLAIELADHIAVLMSAVEGERLPQKKIPPGATETLASLVSSATGVLQRGSTVPSTELLDQIRKEGLSFSKKYLVPNFRQGRRIQRKGDDASRVLREEKAEIYRSWSLLFTYITPLLSPTPAQESLIRREALALAMRSLQTTVDLEFPTERASDYALQMLAGLSSAAAMGREFDFFERVSIDQASQLSVEESEVVEGFVTKITLYDRAGAAVDPKLLGVRKGDIVRWLAYEAEITFVGGHISMKDSLIPTGQMQVLSILSGPGKAYRDGKPQTKEAAFRLPGSSKIRGILKGYDASPAGLSVLATTLGQAAYDLNGEQVELAKTLSRFGIEVVENHPTVAEALLSYDPSFSEATKSSTLDILDLLEEEGFDRAVELLMQGDFGAFFMSSSTTASHTLRFGVAAGDFNSAIGSRTHVGVRGRYT